MYAQRAKAGEQLAEIMSQLSAVNAGDWTPVRVAEIDGLLSRLSHYSPAVAETEKRRINVCFSDFILASLGKATVSAGDLELLGRDVEIVSHREAVAGAATSSSDRQPSAGMAARD